MDLLNLYDEQQRQNVSFPGIRREATAEVIRHIALTGQQSWIVYTQVNADNADHIIEREMAYFRQLGHAVEWKLYSHDTPLDLRQRLAAHGFEIDEVEALVVLDTESQPPILNRAFTHDIRRIQTPDGIRAMLAIQSQVDGEDFTWLADELVTEFEHQPDEISLYAAYADQQPVCSAWIRFHTGSDFASLWGGATLDAYRGQGFYSALVAVRAHEARQRGFRYLTVDASPMSRLILEKIGFVHLTDTYPCVWKPQA